MSMIDAAFLGVLWIVAGALHFALRSRMGRGLERRWLLLAAAFSVYFVAERISTELSAIWHLVYVAVVGGVASGCHFLRPLLKGRLALTLMAVVLGVLVNIYIYYLDDLVWIRYWLLGVAMGVLMYLAFSLRRETAETRETGDVL